MCFNCEHINSFITHVSIVTNICVLMVLIDKLNEDSWLGGGVFLQGCNAHHLAKRSYVKGQKCGALQKQMWTQKWTLQMKANN